MKTSPLARGLLIGVLAVSVLFAGCANDDRSPRIIVLAIDGVDPRAVELLMSDGKLPNFSKLHTQGARARLVASKPLLSPVIWTTIATGKPPDQHGIGHFVAVNEATGERLPVTSRMRKVKAIWNILSEQERRVAVVGWWATWPAETVNGTIVSDHVSYHFLFEEGFAETNESPGNVFPPQRMDELAPLVVRATAVDAEYAAGFVDVPTGEFDRTFHFEDDLSHFKWALASTDTNRNIGLHLWEEDRPDLLMVYLEGVDSTSHLFGHLFRAEDLSGELAEQQRRYGRTVEQMYVHADRIVGEFMEVMDSQTTLVVLSDHGFELGALPDDPSKLRDMRRVSEKYHREEGILYLYGRGVKGETQIQDASILDITPTLLALGGIPVATDMAGRVLAQGLDIDVPAPVATYQSGATETTDHANGSSVDPEMLERLRSLGYIGVSSPSSDRTLAAVHFEAGRYEDAVRAYAEMVEETPDDAGLRTSLAGALGALGRYEQALEQLAVAVELDPLNPEAYHNRAVIFERSGDLQGAIDEYRTAVRYRPGYEPSSRALQRLLGTSAQGESREGAEDDVVFLMAQRASEAARRGDYIEAMKLLDEAQRLEPDRALVYQYRSNVAYLMGDKEAAVAALRKGLEIEPDNMLFRENLRRIQQSPEDLSDQ